jgi:beta-glucosidase/6-phospho-beta-glucosidase/beta-galactosidase
MRGRTVASAALCLLLSIASAAADTKSTKSSSTLSKAKQAKEKEEEYDAFAPAPGPGPVPIKYTKTKEEEKIGEWFVGPESKRIEEENGNKTMGCLPYEEAGPNSKYPFFLGTGLSAYQSEGAAMKDGRGPSIWDTFSKWSGRVSDDATGDTAADFYNKYKQDIKLMKQLGIRNFRFSIAWSRIIPKGNGTVNTKGVQFYQNLVKELQNNCIEPHVTLYHWDLPYDLQAGYKGWIDYKITDNYAAYAELMFKSLPTVKHWSTFASPYSFCMLGYGWGSHAPGRCDDCPGGGDMATEPYMCARNVVIGHAKAASKFRKYHKDGKLGMALNIDWAEPWDAKNRTHRNATERHFDLAVRIFADPLYKARFPETIKKMVPSLPRLTGAEVELLRNGRPDFFGLTHYTANFIKADPFSPKPMLYTQVKEARNGTNFGQVAGSPWLEVYPEGLRKTLNWIAAEYEDPEIIILENGVSVPNEADMAPPAVLDDAFRRDYYESYLDEAKKAVHLDDLQVTGYYAWSFLDQFEWADGYTTRFGSVYVNWTSLERKPKNSAYWLSRAFDVLPPDVDYTKVLYIPANKTAMPKSKKAGVGSQGPINLQQFAADDGALPPALQQVDPSTQPFAGGR